MLITNEEELKAAGNFRILDVVQRAGYTVKKRGKEWHVQGDNSLRINENKERVFEHSPKSDGQTAFTAVDFLMTYAGLTYPKALELISDVTGVVLVRSEEKQQAKPKRRLRGAFKVAVPSEAKKDNEEPTKPTKPEKTAKESDLAELIHKAFLETANRPYTCTFTRWVVSHFGDKGKQALQRYGVTSANTGHTVFWLRNVQGRACRGVMIPYLDRGESVNRNKEGDTSSVQAKLARQREIEYSPENLENPVFGAHLLRNSPQTICICEAPKTAVLATILQPKINNKPVLWLAVNGAYLDPLNSITSELRGKEVLLFPDEGQADKWGKSRTVKALTSDGLSIRLASTYVQGLAHKEDFADVLLSEYFADQNRNERLCEAVAIAMEGVDFGTHDVPTLYNKCEVQMTRNQFVTCLNAMIKKLDLHGVATANWVSFRPKPPKF